MLNQKENSNQIDQHQFYIFSTSNSIQSEENALMLEIDKHWEQNQYKRKKCTPVFESGTQAFETNISEKQKGNNYQDNVSEIYKYFYQDDEDQFQLKISTNPQSKKQKKQEKQTNPQFQNIFNLKTITQKKNNNVPKHFMKRFVELYNVKGKKFVAEQEDILKQVNKLMLNERKMYKQIKNWNNNLDAMQKLFGIDEKSRNSKKKSFLMRKMAHALIKDEIIPGIFTNKQIKDMAKSYVYTLKVQMIRCRNSSLMKRTEII